MDELKAYLANLGIETTERDGDLVLIDSETKGDVGVILKEELAIHTTPDELITLVKMKYSTP